MAETTLGRLMEENAVATKGVGALKESLARQHNEMEEARTADERLATRRKQKLEDLLVEVQKQEGKSWKILPGRQRDRGWSCKTFLYTYRTRRTGWSVWNAGRVRGKRRRRRH